ncbi:MAG: nucleotide exchange factor GrpE [Gammaproteobacteria bacterium]|nr:nucleotide exchange factor GrpE [Gammaproteobacteria bacterium]
MSEETNSSGHTAKSQGEHTDNQDQAAKADAQARQNSQIRVEGEGQDAESPAMEDIEQQAEMDLSEALQRLEEAEQMVRKHQEDMLRVQAEMQNLRRRTEQDVEKAHKYGQERFVTELLSVIDNLERALDAASGEEGEDEGRAGQSPDTLKAIKDGVDLTLKNFLDCFRKFNIEPIDPLGEPFDPQLHQAMATVEDDNVEPNTVTMVMQKGYLLHGRVVRPAMVMVSK